MIKINVNGQQYELSVTGTKMERMVKGEEKVGIQIGLDIKNITTGEEVGYESLKATALGTQIETLIKNLVEYQKLSFSKSLK